MDNNANNKHATSDENTQCLRKKLAHTMTSINDFQMQQVTKTSVLTKSEVSP